MEKLNIKSLEIDIVTHKYFLASLKSLIKNSPSNEDILNEKNYLNEGLPFP